MGPWASPAQLASDISAIRQETRWLEDLPKRASDPCRSAHHAKLAHISSDSFNVALINKFSHFRQSPTCCHPWMFMEKVSSACPLVIINLNTKADVSFCLFHILIKLRHPHCIVLVHVFVEFLQSRKERARWRSNNQHWFITQYGLPCLVPIRAEIKVESILDVHRLPRLQPVVFAYCRHTFRTEHLADVSTQDLAHKSSIRSKLKSFVRVNLRQIMPKNGMIQYILIFLFRNY